MRSAVIVLIFASTQVSAAQDLQDNYASIQPFITLVNETLSCSIQQQRETVLHIFRNMIASNLNDITRPCKGENWTRIAYLDMSDPVQSCPPAWRDLSANGVRVCGRPAGSFSRCHSTFYHAGHSYSRVCGRVIGHQFGHTDAFHSHMTIDQPYVEGVSITHGSPQSHIWTLAADLRENFNGCPCEGGESPPPFVGTNYYCESGYSGTVNPPSVLYTSDPLWDGAECESEGSCCSTAPWFTVDIVNPTTDDIEVRICATSGNGEDTPIHLLEIYIQ